MKALIVIDLQNEFSKIVTEEMVINIEKVVKTFRNLRLPVYWIYSIYHEVTPNKEEIENRLLGTHTGSPMCVRGSDGCELIPSTEALASSYGTKVEKHWFSAFKDTELQTLLTKDKVTELFICGVTLNTCIPATANAAVNLQYPINLVSDCSNSFSPTKRSSGIDSFSLLPNSKVTSADEIITQLTTYGSLDTKILYDFAPFDIDFEDFKNEITWHDMIQQGRPAARVISIQGLINEDGDEPIYRKPMDFQPKLVSFTPTIQKLREYVQDQFGQVINHVVIQLYRSAADHIGKHSDKTLDIKHNSVIFNYSIGATRTMLLSEKKKEKESQRILMRNNSLLCIGKRTNREWHHSVAKDGRSDTEKSDDELQCNQQRISITLRHIDTYITPQGTIYGQGARKDGNLTEDDTDALIHAFSTENSQGAEFDWEKHYGCGFNAVNLEKKK